MTTNQALRASDQDREHTVEILRAHYGEGRLTMEEFDERMGAAYQAKTWGDLLELTADLPVQAQGTSQTERVPEGAGVSARRRARAAFALLALLLAVTLVSSLRWGVMGHGHYHGHPVFPVVPVLVIAFLVMRLRRRGRYR